MDSILLIAFTSSLKILHRACLCKFILKRKIHFLSVRCIFILVTILYVGQPKTITKGELTVENHVYTVAVGLLALSNSFSNLLCVSDHLITDVF